MAPTPFRAIAGPFGSPQAPPALPAAPLDIPWMRLEMIVPLPSLSRRQSVAAVPPCNGGYMKAAVQLPQIPITRGNSIPS